MEWLDFREPVSAWTHAAWLLLSVPATLLLLRESRGDRAKQFGFLIYGMSLVACFAGSTVFHGVQLPEPQLEVFATLDAIGIYLLIAGSITPIALVMLRGRWRCGILTLAWVSSAAGIILCLAPVDVPRSVSTSLYLAMGWGVALCYFELARIVSHKALRPVVFGGVSYSVGAVLNLVHWPVIYLGVFEAHELFHLFVMAGSLAHFLFMLKVVAPFDGTAVEVGDGAPKEFGLPSAAYNEA